MGESSGGMTYLPGWARHNFQWEEIREDVPQCAKEGCTVPKHEPEHKISEHGSDEDAAPPRVRKDGADDCRSGHEQARPLHRHPVAIVPAERRRSSAPQTQARERAYIHTNRHRHKHAQWRTTYGNQKNGHRAKIGISTGFATGLLDVAKMNASPVLVLPSTSTTCTTNSVCV